MPSAVDISHSYVKSIRLCIAQDQKDPQGAPNKTIKTENMGGKHSGGISFTGWTVDRLSSKVKNMEDFRT